VAKVTTAPMAKMTPAQSMSLTRRLPTDNLQQIAHGSPDGFLHEGEPTMPVIGR
jgi:hypothetical protein